MDAPHPAGMPRHSSFLDPIKNQKKKKKRNKNQKIIIVKYLVVGDVGCHGFGDSLCQNNATATVSLDGPIPRDLDCVL